MTPVSGVARRAPARPRDACAIVATRTPAAVTTLDSVLAEAWDALARLGTATCPLCSGMLEAHGSGASCRSCGSHLC